MELEFTNSVVAAAGLGGGSTFIILWMFFCCSKWRGGLGGGSTLKDVEVVLAQVTLTSPLKNPKTHLSLTASLRHNLLTLTQNLPQPDPNATTISLCCLTTVKGLGHHGFKGNGNSAVLIGKGFEHKVAVRSVRSADVAELGLVDRELESLRRSVTVQSQMQKSGGRLTLDQILSVGGSCGGFHIWVLQISKLEYLPGLEWELELKHEKLRCFVRHKKSGGALSTKSFERKSKAAAELSWSVFNFQKEQDLRVCLGYDVLDKTKPIIIRFSFSTVILRSLKIGFKITTTSVAPSLFDS
ncbi:hypothetical protein ACFE04_028342 [Oxalis oulophora]